MFVAVVGDLLKYIIIEKFISILRKFKSKLKIFKWVIDNCYTCIILCLKLFKNYKKKKLKIFEISLENENLMKIVSSKNIKIFK